MRCAGHDHFRGEYTDEQRAHLDLVLAFNRELAAAGVCGHGPLSKARRAAAMASRASLSSPSATLATTLWSNGLMTSRPWPRRGVVQAPSM